MNVNVHAFTVLVNVRQTLYILVTTSNYVKIISSKSIIVFEIMIVSYYSCILVTRNIHRTNKYREILKEIAIP